MVKWSLVDYIVVCVKLRVVSGAESYDYFIPRGKQLNVVNGEHVSAGDQLTSGAPVLHDILRILGPDVVQKYLVDQIQEIYRLQGIDINDRHIDLLCVKCCVKFVLLKLVILIS